ncbi:MAG: sensor histidine kinase [Desulfosalsimonas sp.]
MEAHMAGNRIFSDLSNQPDVIESPASPLKTALAVSLCFFAAGVAYILLSSHIAALAAATVPDLAFIEKTKGFLFIVFTTLMLFAAIYALMLKIDHQQRRVLNFGNRLIAEERRATAAVLADSVSHEIGTVLMSIEYYTTELEEATGEEKAAALEKINQDRAKLGSIARRLGNVARQIGDENSDFFNLSAAVKDSLGFAGRHRKLRKCRVDMEGPGEIMFMGNLLLIYQMTINMIINAAEAAGPGARILVRLSEDNDSAFVEVHDNGPGIEENRRKLVMDPFYTTKKNGSGLGLLSVQACANAHQGEVRISDSDMGGACFSVRLKKTPPVINDAAV